MGIGFAAGTAFGLCGMDGGAGGTTAAGAGAALAGAGVAFAGAGAAFAGLLFVSGFAFATDCFVAAGFVGLALEEAAFAGAFAAGFGVFTARSAGVFVLALFFAFEGAGVVRLERAAERAD